MALHSILKMWNRAGWNFAAYLKAKSFFRLGGSVRLARNACSRCSARRRRRPTRPSLPCWWAGGYFIRAFVFALVAKTSLVAFLTLLLLQQLFACGDLIKNNLRKYFLLKNVKCRYQSQNKTKQFSVKRFLKNIFIFQIKKIRFVFYFPTFSRNFQEIANL